MDRPLIEVADIVRAVGKSFVENSRDWITGQHLKALKAIERCRTADLGYHLDECTNPECGVLSWQICVSATLTAEEWLLESAAKD